MEPVTDFIWPTIMEKHHNIVLTKRKTIQEATELWNWADDHCMEVTFMGGYLYHIEGDEDAILFKLRWGV